MATPFLNRDAAEKKSQGVRPLFKRLGKTMFSGRILCLPYEYACAAANSTRRWSLERLRASKRFSSWSQLDGGLLPQLLDCSSWRLCKRGADSEEGGLIYPRFDRFAILPPLQVSHVVVWGGWRKPDTERSVATMPAKRLVGNGVTPDGRHSVLDEGVEKERGGARDLPFRTNTRAGQGTQREQERRFAQR